MRAWDITVLIICFELALQLIIGCGLYAQNMNFYTPSQTPVMDVTGYSTGNSNNATQKLFDGAKQSNSDYFSIGMGLVTAGNLFVTILGSAAFVYWPLTTGFGVPPMLAAIIQFLIWTTYVIGLVQFMSGRSTTLMS
jgi:hypothetical protein